MQRCARDSEYIYNQLTRMFGVVDWRVKWIPWSSSSILGDAFTLPVYNELSHRRRVPTYCLNVYDLYAPV